MQRIQSWIFLDRDIHQKKAASKYNFWLRVFLMSSDTKIFYDCGCLCLVLGGWGGGGWYGQLKLVLNEISIISFGNKQKNNPQFHTQNFCTHPI